MAMAMAISRGVGARSEPTEEAEHSLSRPGTARLGSARLGSRRVEITARGQGGRGSGREGEGGGRTGGAEPRRYVALGLVEGVNRNPILEIGRAHV